MKLKDSILNQIKENRPLRGALMDLHEVAESTVLRWLRDNHPHLIKYSSLQVIGAYLKQDIDAMIVQEEHDFKKVI